MLLPCLATSPNRSIDLSCSACQTYQVAKELMLLHGARLAVTSPGLVQPICREASPGLNELPPLPRYIVFKGAEAYMGACNSWLYRRRGWWGNVSIMHSCTVVAGNFMCAASCLCCWLAALDLSPAARGLQQGSKKGQLQVWQMEASCCSRSPSAGLSVSWPPA